MFDDDPFSGMGGSRFVISMFLLVCAVIGLIFTILIVVLTN